jgi:hypothetical protein
MHPVANRVHPTANGFHAAWLEASGAELAAIITMNEADGDVVEIGSESRSNKRRRA